jgi:hypothetical protein
MGQRFSVSIAVPNVICRNLTTIRYAVGPLIVVIALVVAIVAHAMLPR